MEILSIVRFTSQGLHNEITIQLLPKSQCWVIEKPPLFAQVPVVKEARHEAQDHPQLGGSTAGIPEGNVSTLKRDEKQHTQPKEETIIQKRRSSRASSIKTHTLQRITKAQRARLEEEFEVSGGFLCIDTMQELAKHCNYHYTEFVNGSTTNASSSDVSYFSTCAMPQWL